MDKQTNHIDQLIREKFENFAPAPPAHVWEGVQSGIVGQPSSVFASTRFKVAAAAVVLLLVSLGLWWMMPDGSADLHEYDGVEEVIVDSSDENNRDDLNSEPSALETDTENTKDKEQSESAFANVDKTAFAGGTDGPAVDETETEEGNAGIDNSSGSMADEPTEIYAESGVEQANNYQQKSTEGTTDISTIDIDYTQPEATMLLSPIAGLNMPLQTETNTSIINEPPEVTALPGFKPKAKTNKWAQGAYFSADIMFTDFDSVELLPAYAVNYEPSYFINDNLFLRFGVGVSYQRERGFAKLDYISNEKIGTYEQVYEITFDSVGDEIVPTYHTKTTDVWDTVRHIQVSEVTNKYLYIQTPLLFGYHKKETKFNWYFYGGPALNLMISKWIEEPQEDVEMIEIVDLQNNLPERSPYYVQLWVGAGIEYKIGNQLALAIEPNYRYSFNHVYKNDQYKTGLSSFSLRFGLVFTVK